MKNLACLFAILVSLPLLAMKEDDPKEKTSKKLTGFKALEAEFEEFSRAELLQETYPLGSETALKSGFKVPAEYADRIRNVKEQISLYRNNKNSIKRALESGILTKEDADEAIAGIHLVLSFQLTTIKGQLEIFKGFLSLLELGAEKNIDTLRAHHSQKKATMKKLIYFFEKLLIAIEQKIAKTGKP